MTYPENISNHKYKIPVIAIYKNYMIFVGGENKKLCCNIWFDCNSLFPLAMITGCFNNTTPIKIAFYSYIY